MNREQKTNLLFRNQSKQIRNLIKNFNVVISILAISLFDYLMGLDTIKLNVPSEFHVIFLQFFLKSTRNSLKSKFWIYSQQFRTEDGSSIRWNETKTKYGWYFSRLCRPCFCLFWYSWISISQLSLWIEKTISSR